MHWHTEQLSMSGQRPRHPLQFRFQQPRDEEPQENRRAETGTQALCLKVPSGSDMKEVTSREARTEGRNLHVIHKAAGTVTQYVTLKENGKSPFAKHGG